MIFFHDTQLDVSYFTTNVKDVSKYSNNDIRGMFI